MSTTTKSPPLRLLLAELRAQAERTGEDRSLSLSGGARVAWRVRGGAHTFAVSRQGVRVGDREIEVFKAQAGVPSGAERVPGEGQMPRDGWFTVVWKWTSTESNAQ